MQQAALGLIRAYQRFLSPVLSRWVCCRFYPTCSEYAYLSIQRNGLMNGTRMSIRRLRRCRPDNLDSCIDLP
jgi:putative membrane protein insertion efficiency factor